MKSMKVMKGGKCDGCSCGKRGGAYGSGSVSSIGAPLNKMGGARKSKSRRSGVKKSLRTRRTRTRRVRRRSNRVKNGGSLKCPGWKLNLEDQIMGKSVVDRYETCANTN